MKPAQLESQLVRVLSNAISELSDPRVPLIVTVERVSVTSDFGIARVYLSTLGDMGPLMAALEHAKGHLQREVARAVKLKRTPTLEFFDAGTSRL